MARFFEIVRRQAGLLRDDRLPFLVAQLDTLIEAGDDPSTADVDLDHGDAVHVLTYHKAKGLEFPIVLMVGLVDDRFPTAIARRPAAAARERSSASRLPEGDHHLAEERRLFYVGMTRAREELHLSWARDYGGAHRATAEPVRARGAGPAAGDPGRAAAAQRARSGWRATSARRRQPAAAARAAPASGDRQLRSATGRSTTTSTARPAIATRTSSACRRRHRTRWPTAAPSTRAVQAYPPPAAGRPGHVARGAARPSWMPPGSRSGFLTREHEEARRAAAREALDRFWDEQQLDPARPVAVERGVLRGHGPRPVRGRYDRVDVDADGRVVITDYKSSDVRDPATAARRSRDSLQLSIYALAYESQHGRLPDELALHFLDSGMVGRSAPTPKRLEKAASQVGDGERRDPRR